MDPYLEVKPDDPLAKGPDCPVNLDWSSGLPPREKFLNGYVLGLDIGSNSVGWAAIPCSLVDGNPVGSLVEATAPDAASGPRLALGVRIFAEGTLKEKGGPEVSRATARRMARQQRRQIDRRRRRHRKTAHVLESARLLPSDPDERRRVEALDPYELRARGLTERLEPFELGRAFFHLAKRRGFRAGLRDSTKDDKDLGVVKTGISELEAKMAAAKTPTLGAYLARLDPHQERRRKHYTNREMHQEEFEALWAAQKTFHTELLDDTLKAQLHDAIFFQRPLKPVVPGDCRLESGEKRALAASWYAHQFRVLKEIANLRLIEKAAGAERNLSAEERQTIIDMAMSTKGDLKFSEMRKALGCKRGDTFNLENGERKSIKGQTVEAHLREIFHDRWATDADSLRFGVWEVFPNSEGSDEAIQARAINDWKITEEELRAMAAIRAGKGTIAYSVKALKRLLPHLEAGKDEFQALEAEYPHRNKGEAALDLLPPVEAETIINPAVRRALSETRKVVNALIREYGKPRRIVVELAREAKGSIAQRQRQIKRIRENEDARKRAAAKIHEYSGGIIPPNRENIRKVLLWDECDHTCPYTGKGHIGLEDLFCSPPRFEIEHIWPYSRSMDDGFMNVTLCEARENREVKRDRTPFEAYSGDPARWKEIQDRLALMKRMPLEKRRRFLAHEIPEDFAPRQLTDTSHSARQAVAFIGQLYASEERTRCVKTTRGTVTSDLSHYWGLDRVLPRPQEEALRARKDRGDHRHHAVDAVVIALTTPAHIHTLSQRFDQVYRDSQRFTIPPPWENIWADVRLALHHLNVSFRPERKLQAGFTNDTSYGRIENGPYQGKYVYRVPLEKLTLSQAKNICDPAVKRLVFDRLTSRGVNTDARNERLPSNWHEGLQMPSRNGPGPAIRKVRVWKSLSNVVPSPSERPFRYMESGGNHHLCLYRGLDKQGRSPYFAEVCTRFEAIKRKRQGVHIVRREHPDHPEWEFVMSLMIDDAVLYRNDDRSQTLYRVQKMSLSPAGNFEFVLRLAAEATLEKATEPERLVFKSFPRFSFVDNQCRLQKVYVDPLGRITPCND